MDLYRKADLSILGERTTTERRQGLKRESAPENDEPESTTEEKSATYKSPFKEHHSYRNGNVMRSRRNKTSKSGPFSEPLEPSESEDTPTLRKRAWEKPRRNKFGMSESVTRQLEVAAEADEKTSKFSDPISHSGSFGNKEDVNRDEVIGLKAGDQTEHKIGKSNTPPIATSSKQPPKFAEQSSPGVRMESFAHEDARPRHPKDPDSWRVSTNSYHQLRSTSPIRADASTTRQLHPNIETQEVLFQSSKHPADASDVPIRQHTVTQQSMFIKGTISEDRSGDQESVTSMLLAALHLRDGGKLLQPNGSSIGNLPSDVPFPADVEDFSDYNIEQLSAVSISSRGSADPEEYTTSSTRIYLGNLPRLVTKSDVEQHFSIYPGEITEIRLMNGFGFIEYKDALDARDAVPAFHGSTLLGERLIVQFARGPARSRKEDDEERAPPRPRRTPFRMLVTGMSPDVNWQDLKDFARQSGMDVVYSEIDRGHSGKGFVEFESHEDMQQAVARLNNSEFNAQIVRCAEYDFIY